MVEHVAQNNMRKRILASFLKKYSIFRSLHSINAPLTKKKSGTPILKTMSLIRHAIELLPEMSKAVLQW